MGKPYRTTELLRFSLASYPGLLTTALVACSTNAKDWKSEMNAKQAKVIKGNGHSLHSLVEELATKLHVCTIKSQLVQSYTAEMSHSFVAFGIVTRAAHL